MKRFALIALIVTLAGYTLTGCAAPDPVFLDAAERYHNRVGESWKTYVEADANLDPFEKRIRIEAHDEFGKAIAKHKELR